MPVPIEHEGERADLAAVPVLALGQAGGVDVVLHHELLAEGAARSSASTAGLPQPARPPASAIALRRGS